MPNQGSGDGSHRCLAEFFSGIFVRRTHFGVIAGWAVWLPLLAAALMFTGRGLASESGRRQDAKPNIIFFYTDDQAPTAIGLETPQLKTPHIDRIFGEGVRLTRAFVTTPVCSPARAGLMASRYGSEVGITDWINPRQEPELGLNPGLPTWPKVLAKEGYHTALVGKWHLGTADRFHPTKFGYQEFFGFRSGGNSPQNPTLEVDGVTAKVPGYTPDVLTDYAIDFIRRHRKGPFLLSLHFRAPHSPWSPVRAVDREPYQDLDPEIPDPGLEDLDVEKIKKWTRQYYASLTSVDRNIGRVLARLDQWQLAENTVVIFTSDHGYNLGHHGIWFKGNALWMLKNTPEQKWANIPAKRRPNLYDQSLLVPTAVRWPARIKAGTVVSRTVTNLDWFPTLVAIAGAKMPSQTIRGRNALPLLLGQNIPWDDDLYAEYSMHHGAKTQMRCLRTTTWKLMIDLANPGRAELYHLAEDPGERTNLAGSSLPHIRQVQQQLTERIQAKFQELTDSD